jgi:hypothetical protein
MAGEYSRELGVKILMHKKDWHAWASGKAGNPDTGFAAFWYRRTERQNKSCIRGSETVSPMTE